MAIQQHRRQYTQLKMSPYNSTAGQGEEEIGKTLSGIGQLLAETGKTVGKIGDYKEIEAKRIEDEEAKAAGRTGRGGGLTDEAEAKLADAQLGAFEDLSAANNRIREKYRDNPDGEKMNAELRDAYESVRSKYEKELDSAALKAFRKSVDSNMREFIRANYTDSRSRKAAIAAKKEKALKEKIATAQQSAIYNAGRKGAPIEEVAAQIVPKELQENPNMPVSPEVKRQVEAIPALYVAGAIDKPAYDSYDDDGNLDVEGIIPAQDIHAPVNFDKKIDDYYDRIIEDIEALPGLTDYQKKKFTEKADLAREMRKQDFHRYLGEYKTGATADFIRDPQSDLLDSALFHNMPDGYVEPEITEERLKPYLDEGYSEDEAIEYIQHGDPLGAETDSGTEPKIQWEEKPIKKEMQRLADNAYKPSTAPTPNVATAATVVHKLQIPEALDVDEMETQSEIALHNVNEILEDPATTNEERIAVRQISANSLEDPEYRAAANELFAKAQILDLYAGLFDESAETDDEFKQNKWNKYNSGIMTEFKSGEKTFNFTQASERNRQKYKLVRDTYLNVLQSAAKGDIESANEMIDALPYNVAKINYGGMISPGMIDQFRVIDADGTQTVKPQFMYKGYNFEYLGMDKTGVILARRKL